MSIFHKRNSVFYLNCDSDQYFKRTRVHPYEDKIFLYYSWKLNVFFHLKSPEISQLALCASFEYISGSMANINIYSFSARIDFRRQNLIQIMTSVVGFRVAQCS